MNKKKFKKYCVDCNKQVGNFNAKRCWLCHCAFIKVVDKECIDCGKKLNKYKKAIRCHSCEMIIRHENIDVVGKNNPRYKDGRCSKQYYCKTCKKKIGINSGIYGSGL